MRSFVNVQLFSANVLQGKKHADEVGFTAQADTLLPRWTRIV